MLYYDLKTESKRKSIGNAIARDIELRRIARTVKRQYNNNCLVRGASGTGKSALLEAFAYRCATGKIEGFEDAALIKLDTGSLKKSLAQANNAEMVAYLNAAFSGLPANTIVFVDDFDNAVPERKISEMAQIFSPFFERNDLKLCISMQETHYNKLHEENPSFFQNFEEIDLKETDVKETAQILEALKPAFEKEYGISIEPQTLKVVSESAKKINDDKKMPLRAIHLLDEALAFAKISGEKALGLKHVQEIFAEKTGLPSHTLSATDTTLLKNLEDVLRKSVIGQDAAIKRVADVVRRSRMGLRNPNRPNGSFLFMGPSGVGKTELSKTLAKIVYGTERAFARIDMSEFSEQHTVHRLIGAPPGYIGFENGGQLTNTISRQPYSLVLLDEIEKAHAKIFDIFLQVLDDGRLTDGQGKTVSFTNSIVIATSNLGIQEIVQTFENGGDVNDPKFVEKTMMPILLKHFRTEFLNRFDAIIVFNPLSVDDLVKVAYLEIKKIEERTAEHKVKFNIEERILRQKIEQIADLRFGARPVKRFVEQTCENLIVTRLLQSRLNRQG